MPNKPSFAMGEPDPVFSFLEKFFRSLNPKKRDQNILIYGREYKLWRDGNFIGIGIWTKDNNVGDSFQNIEVEGGNVVNKVFVADKWELVMK